MGTRERILARTNYQFEKRRKELLKQKKKEEKRQRKLERTSPKQAPEDSDSPPGDAAEE